MLGVCLVEHSGVSPDSPHESQNQCAQKVGGGSAGSLGQLVRIGTSFHSFLSCARCPPEDQPFGPLGCIGPGLERHACHVLAPTLIHSSHHAEKGVPIRIWWEL